jgi:hypothetical protein
MVDKKDLTWKRKLAALLSEHPDIGDKMTGQVTIHMNEGGISKVYSNKEVK